MITENLKDVEARVCAACATQAGIERPTDTTISYVERGRAFAKKQAEWNQQVKNQTVPPDRTPHIKSPDAVQASRQKELPVKTAKQPAQAMGPCR